MAAQSIAAPANTPHTYADHGAQLQAAAATATAELSQQLLQKPNAAAALGRKRRASGVPGSRGVANLTPDQLAKKRANDREAQRAIRERTRNNIESLEKRIRELESQRPFQELQRVIQERDRALADCEELRRRLGAVAGIAGGQQTGLNELATLTAQQSPLPPVSQSQHSYMQASGSPYEQQHIHPDLRSPQSSVTQGTPASQATYDAGERSMRKWSPSPGHPRKAHSQYESAPNGADYDQRTQAGQLPTQGGGERLGVNFLIDSSQHRHAPSMPSSGQAYASPLLKDLPIHQRLTLHSEASCPLDYLLLDFHASRRKMLRDGANPLEAIGPEYPAFSSMTTPGAYPEPHPVSALLIDILSKFPDISRLPEKVAVLYIMFLVMRWLICPCKECYDRLPEWCRPVSEQLDRPHVAWCDYLPWPHMRKTISLNEKTFKFDDFFVPYCQTLSLNWPLPPDCVLLDASSSTVNEAPTLKINPAFEHHLRKLENWSLGNRFKRAFPELVDESVWIKDA